MTILAIETANKTLSVALVQQHQVVYEKTMTQTLQHSIFLAPSVEEVMKQANMDVTQLKAIAISNGPGSYTGLRIGVTFAKTLAYTLNIPIIPVSSLKVLANSVTTKLIQSVLSTSQMVEYDVKQQLIISFFDARRGNVFIGGYIGETMVVNDCHVNMANYLCQLKEQQKQPFCFVSPDIAIYEELIKTHYPNTLCIEGYPSAGTLGFLSDNEPNVNCHELTPYYLKLAEAEENWLNTQANHQLGQWVDRGAF